MVPEYHQDVDVVTIGSIHLDQQFLVRDLPQAGETVLASSVLRGLGGKGANQAVAAARSGARSALIGFVGADAAATDLLARLDALGVDTAGVISVEGSESGAAAVVRARSGANQIIVSAGASAKGDLSDVLLLEAISRCKVLILQGEISPSLSRRAAVAAASAGVRVVINLAPVIDLGEALSVADPLVVNEIEATQLLGVAPGEDVWSLAERLRGHARSVVVTLGSDGAVFVGDAGSAHVPAPLPARVVDTTGAGDAFVGSMAARLALGDRLSDAVEFAVTAATRSVEYAGAAEGYPFFEETLS